MLAEEGAPGSGLAELRPEAPLGHLAHLGFALAGAVDVDEVARHLLTDMVALPGVHRVGMALVEGGGRRLLFTASDRVAEDELVWCHIDAYDDSPVTQVVRTGESFLGPRETYPARYAEFIDRQPPEYEVIGVVPLPGQGSPLGGLVLYLDRTWSFTEAQRRWLDATARRAAGAVRRVRHAGASSEPVASWSHEDAVTTATLRLPPEPQSAGMARRFLRGFLADAELDDEVVELAQLCLSELVTNAVVHAGGDCELTATLDRSLTVTVRDRGSAPAETRVALDLDAGADPLRVHGRGLQLVDALADRWGTEQDGTGTTVWFSLALTTARAEDRTG